MPSEKSEADFRIQASEKFINSSIFNQRFTFLKNKSSFIFMLYFFMLYWSLPVLMNSLVPKVFLFIVVATGLPKHFTKTFNLRL